MTTEERQREHSTLEQERKRVPDLFHMEPLLDSPEMLRWIGIEEVFGEYPLGHIKYTPQDFIVEEIAGDKSISTVDVGSAVKSLGGKGATFYGELVKADMTTFAAREEVARILGTSIEDVGTAGLKDEVAITSQRISLRKVQDVQKLEHLQDENFFVKNITRGKGVLKRGDLYGNRFFIVIRTPQTISEKEKARVQKELKKIAEQGFWNFFSFQRFAAPRLNGHFIGKHLLKEEYKEAIENLLFFQSSREEPYFRRIREEVKEHWGNWQRIEKAMTPFPSRFPTELQVLRHLKSHPGDFVGALRTIPDQVRLWVYAYASFLFNKRISQAIKKGEVPFKLPFITSRHPTDWEWYREFLEQDKIVLPPLIYRTFPFLRTPSFVVSPAVPTLQTVEVHNVHFLEKMMVLAFSLPKGTYATTFLAHLFQLSSEAPFPDGIDTNIIDSKALLELGLLTSVFEHFHGVLGRMAEKRSAGGR